MCVCEREKGEDSYLSFSLSLRSFSLHAFELDAQLDSVLTLQHFTCFFCYLFSFSLPLGWVGYAGKWGVKKLVRRDETNCFYMYQFQFR